MLYVNRMRICVCSACNPRKQCYSVWCGHIEWEHTSKRTFWPCNISPSLHLKCCLFYLSFGGFVFFGTCGQVGHSNIHCNSLILAYITLFVFDANSSYPLITEFSTAVKLECLYLYGLLSVLWINCRFSDNIFLDAKHFLYVMWSCMLLSYLI